MIPDSKDGYTMGATIVGIGEVLWDVFPDYKRPGGAPCNVAYHATQLGNRGVIASRIGYDAYGAELRDVLAERALDITFLQIDPEHPTGTVEVTLVDGEPAYRITEGVAWDFMVMDPALRRLADEADAVCFVSLAQRATTTRHTVQQFLAATRPETLRVFDVNLRPPFVDADVLRASFAVADVVKMGEAESEAVAALLGRDALVPWLLQDQGVRVICLTRGRNGAELITADSHERRPGEVVDVSQGDAVGVGDAFLAAVTHHLVRGSSLADTLAAANRYAALIATCRGGMPHLSPEALAPFV